jgi:hypothetical protein
MGVFSGMFPIQAGEEEDARAFAAETMGAPLNEDRPEPRSSPADAPGHLAAPGGPRDRWFGEQPAREPVQVPLSRYQTAPEHHRALAGRTSKGETMRITLTSVLVDDQSKALRFYTDVLWVHEEDRGPDG